MCPSLFSLACRTQDRKYSPLLTQLTGSRLTDCQVITPVSVTANGDRAASPAQLTMESAVKRDRVSSRLTLTTCECIVLLKLLENNIWVKAYFENMLMGSCYAKAPACSGMMGTGGQFCRQGLISLKLIRPVMLTVGQISAAHKLLLTPSSTNISHL